jgi:hypothetical protein
MLKNADAGNSPVPERSGLQTERPDADIPMPAASPSMPVLSYANELNFRIAKKNRNSNQ